MPASIDPGKKSLQENIIQSIKDEYNSLDATQRDQIVKEKIIELSNQIESASEQLGCLVEYIETTGSLYKLFPDEDARILLQKCRAKLVTGHEMEGRLRNTEIDSIEATGTDLYGLFEIPGSKFAKGTFAIIRKILRAVETTAINTSDDGDDTSGRHRNIIRASHVKTKTHDFVLQYRQLSQILARDLTTNPGMNAFYNWLQTHPWWPNDKVLIRRKRPAASASMGLSRNGKLVMDMEEVESGRHAKRRMSQHDGSISDTEVDTPVHGDGQDSDVSDVERQRSNRDDVRVSVFSSPNSAISNIDPKIWRKDAHGESTNTANTEHTRPRRYPGTGSSTSEVAYCSASTSAPTNSNTESINSTTPELDYVEYATSRVQLGRKRKGKCKDKARGRGKEDRENTMDDESSGVGDEYERNVDARPSANDESIEGGDEESLRRSIEAEIEDDSGDEEEDIDDSFDVSKLSRKGQMDGEITNSLIVVNEMDDGGKPIEAQEEDRGNEAEANESSNCADEVEHRQRHRYGNEEEDESIHSSVDMDIKLSGPFRARSQELRVQTSPLVIRRECVVIPRIIRPRLSRKMERGMKRVGLGQFGDADVEREGQGEVVVGNTLKTGLNEQHEKQTFLEWSDYLIEYLKGKIKEGGKVVEQKMAELDVVVEEVKGAEKEAVVFWGGREEMNRDGIVESCRSRIALEVDMKVWGGSLRGFRGRMRNGSI